MAPDGSRANHAGGILGGISSGQQVVCSVAFKPTSSLRLPVDGVDVDGKAVEIVTTGRHDPCVGIRATPICEAMLALVLMDQALRHRAQCGDVGEVARSEEHTSELQSLMRISYAVFCLKKKNIKYKK